MIPIPTRKNFLDLTNSPPFGRLSIVEYAGVIHQSSGSQPTAHWVCRCDCGKVVTIDSNSLRKGNTQSCGCLQKEAISRVGKMHIKHGMSETVEFKTWIHILNRCTNKNDKAYNHYGGRGVTIDPSWVEFPQFFADMGPRPSDKHSIDRIDNNGNYSKDNCRWATDYEQNNNRRTTRMLTMGGITLSLSNWALRVNIPRKTIRSRLSEGWSDERALTTPIGAPRINSRHL